MVRCEMRTKLIGCGFGRAAWFNEAADAAALMNYFPKGFK
jgi:hypothetical protein